MKKNDVTHGFELIDDSPVPEYNSRGLWFCHQETGMEVYQLYNDDPENMFCYAFKTLPENSCGVAHILEHTVLCGSERYPVKDPFLVLSKQSVKTFLNAMTYPDKTLYPASSFIEADYFNLMDVYGDAVFFPLLDEKMFRQEGHRLVYTPDGHLSIQGVVYNEMKGVYSSHDTAAADAALSSVTRGTLYEFDSGGNPRDIPALTYQQFCEFHRTYYHPSNCRLFLYGNIPAEKQLAYIAERFLSRFSGTARCPAADIPAAPPLQGPVFETVAAPADGNAGNTIVYTWLMPVVSPEIQTEISFLSDLLLGNDGSPLYKALIESDMGEDVSPVSGLQTSLRQLAFSCGLRGVPNSVTAEQFESFVRSTLEAIVKKGFDRDLIESSLLSMEVSSREIVRGWGPYSLTLMQRSLNGWLHGLHPAATMCDDIRYERIRTLLKKNPDHFVQVLKTYLLDNCHCSVVTARSDSEYSDRFEADMQEKLAAKESSCTAEERCKIRNDEETLTLFQQKPETPTDIACIPHVAVSSLSPVLEPLPLSREFYNGIPIYTAEQPVNGILYASIAFPVDTLDAEWYPFAGFYSDILTSCGFNGLPWDQASILCGRYTASLTSSLRILEAVNGASTDNIVDRDWLFIDVKTIPEYAEQALPLIFDMLRTVSFDDVSRIRELLAESINAAKSAIVPTGHRFALSRVSRTFCRNSALTELWSGIDQYFYLEKISRLSDDELIDKIKTLHAKILAAGTLMYVCGDPATLKTALPVCRHQLAASGFAGPQPRNPNRFTGYPPAARTAEAFSAPMQIGFAAASLPGALYGRTECGAELILAHSLSNGSLWNRLRMQGGAYGCNAGSNNTAGIFSFTTFRDPTPEKSPAVFRSCLEEAAGQLLDRDELDKCITGLYANIFPLRTPALKGSASLVYALTGDSVELRQQRLESVLTATPIDVRNAAIRLRDQINAMNSCIIGNRQQTDLFALEQKLSVINLFLD